MNILIINESSHAVPRKFILGWMELMTAHLQKKKVLNKQNANKELTVVFLDRAPAKRMNKQFRGKDYATDILSFDSMEPDSLGELVLCPEVLKKQSKEHGLTYQQELGYMLLHGVLHLLGYDHETSEADARKMFKIQDEAFEKMRPGFW